MHSVSFLNCILDLTVLTVQCRQGDTKTITIDDAFCIFLKLYFGVMYMPLPMKAQLLGSLCKHQQDKMLKVC